MKLPSSTRVRIIALTLTAGALLAAVAVFMQPHGTPVEEGSVRTAAGSPEGSDLAGVGALVEVEDARGAADGRALVIDAPAGAAGVRASRPAYPLASKLDAATLDVLAVWEFTEEPATDQLLQCGSRFARTDASGRVRFTGMPPGYSGLTNNAGSHLSLKLEPGELRSLTFPIRREYGVEGRVVSEAGSPVGGAEVLVCSSSNGPSTALATSSADGTFRLDALADRVYVAARHALHGVSSPVSLSPGNQGAEPLTLVVDGGTGVLEGRVVDSEGFAVSGAQLWYAPARATTLPDTYPIPARSGAYTDDAGRFRFDALRPGRGDLRVWTAKYVPSVSTFEVVRGETATVRVELESGVTLSGRVVHEVTGEPIHQASVLVGEKDDPGLAGAWTDAQGEFVVERVPASAAELRVEVLREVVYAAPIRPVEASSSPIEIRVTPSTLTVDGFVVDEEGHPVVGCEVYAESKDENSYTVTTNEEGAFRISNAPESATALVVYDARQDRQLASRPRVLPASGPVTIVVPSDRLKVGNVRGLVVDPDGKPVADADIEVEFPGGSGWQFTTTVADGTFGIDSVAAGRNALVIRAAGYAEFLSMVQVESGETAELGRLSLQRGTTFRLDLSMDPPLGEGERVDIWEMRLDSGTDRHYLYLGESRETGDPLGPVPAGGVALLLKGAGVRETVQLQVDAGGSTRQALEIQRGVPTRVMIEYPTAAPGMGAPGAGEILSYGQSWTLRSASGEVVESSYRPRRVVLGKPLELHGLEQGAEYTLGATDIEGRSGSVRFRAGTEPTLLLR